jgi:hypothetical protein
MVRPQVCYLYIECLRVGLHLGVRGGGRGSMDQFAQLLIMVSCYPKETKCCIHVRFVKNILLIHFMILVLTVRASIQFYCKTKI